MLASKTDAASIDVETGMKQQYRSTVYPPRAALESTSVPSNGKPSEPIEPTTSSPVSDEVVALALARYWAEEDGIIKAQQQFMDKTGAVSNPADESREKRGKLERTSFKKGKDVIRRFSRVLGAGKL